MSTKLFIGSELADFNEVFNVMFSIGDIRDLSAGSNNKTYTLNLPLTKMNKRLLKFISQPDVKSEPSALGRLYIGEQLIIQGSILILNPNSSNLYAKIIISQNDWIDNLANKKMTDLNLLAFGHTLDHATVEASWTAAYPAYRYPMINFGALASGEQGVNAKWQPNDFISMFSISQMITAILAPYTISSAWLATAFIKDLYILANEKVKSEFINGKNLKVNVTNISDNNKTESVVSGAYNDTDLTKVLSFLTETEDEANAWVTNTYTIPEAGTYRFVGTIVLGNTAAINANLTITGEAVTISLLRNGSPLDTKTTAAYSGTELLDAVTYSLDSGYYHFAHNDLITISLTCNCLVHNIGAVTEYVSVGTRIASTLELVWNNANKHSGLNETIYAEDLMPDMTQVDFLTAIRSIFNLRFWLDKSKQVLYIEPWDQFLSSTVIDLTEFIDFESIDTELISPNYSKATTLKWKDDTSDVAYTEYLKGNASPGSKDIALTSLFAKPGIDPKEHPFSSLITGFNLTINDHGTLVPRIWNTIPEYPYIIFDRKTGFNTRIVHWDGLTAGFTWYYEGDTKMTYPKISGLDWAAIYSTYWQKLFHYIDKGKILTIRMKIKPMFLTQFFTVINTATNEGFRPTYQINDDYYFLQKVTTDGISAELELVLKV